VADLNFGDKITYTAMAGRRIKGFVIQGFPAQRAAFPIRVALEVEVPYQDQDFRLQHTSVLFLRHGQYEEGWDEA
jgi:hypothetical protein